MSGLWRTLFRTLCKVVVQGTLLSGITVVARIEGSCVASKLQLCVSSQVCHTCGNAATFGFCVVYCDGFAAAADCVGAEHGGQQLMRGGKALEQGSCGDFCSNPLGCFAWAIGCCAVDAGRVSVGDAAGVIQNELDA